MLQHTQKLHVIVYKLTVLYEISPSIPLLTHLSISEEWEIKHKLTKFMTKYNHNQMRGQGPTEGRESLAEWSCLLHCKRQSSDAASPRLMIWVSA